MNTDLQRYFTEMPQPEADTTTVHKREKHVAIGGRVVTIREEDRLTADGDDEVMNSRELCDFLQITPQQLYVIRRKRHLPCYKPSGKSLFFLRSEVMLWLTARKDRF